MRTYKLVLGVHKKGDDMFTCLQQCGGESKASLLKLATVYESAASTLIMLAAQKRVSDLRITADCHEIDIDGPEELLNELCEAGVLYRLEERDCHNCGGDGYLRTEDVPCPACAGSGEEPS